MKRQNGHGNTAANVQGYPQIEYRENPLQVPVNESSLEERHKKADHYQYGLICYCNNHQNQCRYRNGNFILPHIVDLHWLASACRGRDGAEEEPHAGV